MRTQKFAPDLVVLCATVKSLASDTSALCLFCFVLFFRRSSAVYVSYIYIVYKCRVWAATSEPFDILSSFFAGVSTFSTDSQFMLYGTS